MRLVRETPLLALVMLVKNEAEGIAETVGSCEGVVDAIVILDTGSTDGTQQIIRDTAARMGVPLLLHEEPFVDFSTSRNRALELARDSAIWTLMLSGEEKLTEGAGLRDFLETQGTDDAYHVTYRWGHRLEGRSARIVRADSDDFRYFGRTHEILLDSRRAGPGGHAPATVHYTPGPIEAKKGRFKEDIRLLRLDATENPGDPRWLFYLAQSHAALGQVEAAHWIYLEVARIAQGARVYEALYRAAQCCKLAGWPLEYRENRLFDAHEALPSRAEPLADLAESFYWARNYERARQCADAARKLSYPTDGLFYDRSAYDYRAHMVAAGVRILAGEHDEAEAILLEVLGVDYLPEEERVRASDYLRICRARRAA